MSSASAAMPPETQSLSEVENASSIRLSRPAKPSPTSVATPVGGCWVVGGRDWWNSIPPPFPCAQSGIQARRAWVGVSGIATTRPTNHINPGKAHASLCGFDRRGLALSGLSGMTTPKIFITYRRKDSEQYSVFSLGLLLKRIAFPERVFWDRDALKAGERGTR